MLGSPSMQSMMGWQLLGKVLLPLLSAKAKGRGSARLILVHSQA